MQYCNRKTWRGSRRPFQYRKRYKGACNRKFKVDIETETAEFQYRKRYKGACNLKTSIDSVAFYSSFNTVNGIRVHAIPKRGGSFTSSFFLFQYRKRYKGACNIQGGAREP